MNAFGASPLESVKTFGNLLVDKKIDASADIYEYVGENIIARGHVVIKFGDTTITADKAIVNIQSQDIEAAGNVTFTRKQKITKLVDFEEYQELLDDPSLKVELMEYVTAATGLKRIRISVENVAGYMKADRLSGNLASGLLQFRNFAVQNGPIFCAAGDAERAPDGTITVNDAKLTTCNYIIDDHAHYSFSASKAVLSPRTYNSGLQNYNADHGDHSIWAYNTMFRLWDTPVLWLPVLYKPMESDSFGVDVDFGQTSDWGYFIRGSKGFSIIDNKRMQLNATAILNYYSERGLAYGGKVNFITQNSRTEVFAVFMRDRNPYNMWDYDDKDDSRWYENHTRLEIPKNRYDVKITNLTHITPSLDFRGQFEMYSDFNFLDDYYSNRYDENIQPPTYAALEYQMPRASAALLTTIRVNSFDTVMERLPEGRFDVPRQELFGGLYYQSETTAGYYQMQWREFDRKAKYGDIKNYSSGRFDTVHFLYYPINLDFLNIIPRAGGRFTAYSNTSKNGITDNDLTAMFAANSIQQPFFGDTTPFESFRDSGGADVRFIGELGIEANTKIYRTWQDVRSAWLELDGLRHVAMPYVNYTYIPKPTLDVDKTLYFDDTDRIHEQNFVRIGLQNTLQTRKGSYGAERISEWASLDTYWDFHGNRDGIFGYVGDIGTKLSLTPFDNFSLTSEVIWDVGQNNEHDWEAERAFGRKAGRVGLSKLKYINMWNSTLSYTISKDWKLWASYMYSDYYYQRGTYSMGSMLNQINATSSTLYTSYPASQMATVGINFPTYIDPRLTGGFSFTYDVNAALMQNMSFRLKRNFHCVDVGVEVGRSCSLNSDQDKDYSHYIAFYVSLTAMPSTMFGYKFGSN